MPTTATSPPRFISTASCAYALLIVYASLYPFVAWRVPDSLTLSNFLWPRFWSEMDMVINLLAYLPLGMLLALDHPASARRAILMASALSLAMECLQFLLPGRVPAALDWLSNSVGALVGVGLVILPPGKKIVAACLHWRTLHTEAHAGWGLVLLGSWFVSQLNPGIPFFEAGHMINQLTLDWRIDPYAALFLVPQAMGVTLNVFGFVLFVSVLLKPQGGMFRLILLVLLTGFILKFACAALMLRAPLMAAWMNPPAVIGLVAGMVAGYFCLRLSNRSRALCATLLVFAGALLSKLSGVYDALDETLRLFDWPYDRYGNFASLTHSLHEIWPLLTVLFLSYCFIRHPVDPHSGIH